MTVRPKIDIYIYDSGWLRADFPSQQLFTILHACTLPKLGAVERNVSVFSHLEPKKSDTK